jgi:hypothetical protein
VTQSSAGPGHAKVFAEFSLVRLPSFLAPWSYTDVFVDEGEWKLVQGQWVDP